MNWNFQASHTKAQLKNCKYVYNLVNNNTYKNKGIYKSINNNVNSISKLLRCTKINANNMKKNY